MFALVVDDFGVKLVGKEHAKNLNHTLNQHYEITEEWTGNKLLGIDLDSNYSKRTVRMSMINCIKQVLKRFNHPMPSKLCYYPHSHQAPTQGAKFQRAPTPDDSPSLST